MKKLILVSLLALAVCATSVQAFHVEKKSCQTEQVMADVNLYSVNAPVIEMKFSGLNEFQAGHISSGIVANVYNQAIFQRDWRRINFKAIATSAAKQTDENLKEDLVKLKLKLYSVDHRMWPNRK